MNDIKLHQPTVTFLIEMSEQVSNDIEATELFDGIADTLGDMLGNQSDYRPVTSRFVRRIIEAAAAAQERHVGNSMAH